MIHNSTNKDNEFENFTQSLLQKKIYKRPGKINQITAKSIKIYDEDKLESLVKKTGIRTTTKSGHSKPNIIILPQPFSKNITKQPSTVQKSKVFSQKPQLPDNDSEMENSQQYHHNTLDITATQTSFMEMEDLEKSVPARLAEIEKKLNVERRVASLEVMFGQFNETLNNLVTDVKAIKNHIVKTSKYDIMLPINYELEELNTKIENDAVFASYLERKLQPYKPTANCSSHTAGLAMVFVDNILAQYNWDGSHGRKEFRSLKGLNEVLYDAWKGGQFNCKASYRILIRAQIHAARQRRFQRNKKRN